MDFETEPMEDKDGLGTIQRLEREIAYLLYHEENGGHLLKILKGLKRIRIFMDILANLSNPIFEVFRGMLGMA